MRSTRLRTTNYLAMLLALCLPACVQAATEAELCARDLEDIAQFMPVNDAGASDALARRGAAINDALLKARGEMPQVSDRAGCDASIYHYLQAWRRGHLWSQPRDNSTAPSRPAGQPGYVRDPTLRVLSKQTIVLTLPSFRSEIQAELKALLTKERAVLAGHPNWIIDVRRNDGGDDATYYPLLPWLMDREFVQNNIELLASAANVRAEEGICAAHPEAKNCAQIVAPRIEALRRAAPGSFVLADAEPVVYQPAAKLNLRRPSHVAVLTDRFCGSSCEQFLLTVRQGRAVKLIGRPSDGELDFSNLRPHELPSGQRTLFYAISRSTRLPVMPVDLNGVQPDILLPAPADDAARVAEVAQAQRWLEGGSLRPLPAKLEIKASAGTAP